MNKSYRRQCIAVLLLFLLLGVAAAQGPQTGTAVVKQLGAVQKVEGNSLTLLTDQGARIAVEVQSGARIFRFAPGQSDPKSATAIHLSDLQSGDRVLVRGSMNADNTVLQATAVAVMKQQDIAHAQQQELLDWQRRGVGGVVKQVDAAAGRIVLSVAGKSTTVTVTEETTYKRYAPDSVHWEDAVAANLADIHPGDQLRAKGEKNEDGSEVKAEQIVAGTFRNVAGLLTGVDAAQSTVTVQDLATKKQILIRITADSQMKVLPAQLAQGLAARLKGGATAGAGHAADAPAQPKGDEAPAGSGAAAARPRGGDLNQMMARLNAVTLADLKKGEAVMILSTEGSPSQAPTAITLLSGVEPLLTASRNGSGVESFLTPWSLAGTSGGDQ
ncbi:MAG: DUF5666 domain-containing protein [Acidobacteriota bacterium]|nr:DUF5666 domain-containing protein [Acidobacteriota bacterium]